MCQIMIFLSVAGLMNGCVLVSSLDPAHVVLTHDKKNSGLSSLSALHSPDEDKFSIGP
jgi:hypothetical protein